MNSRIARWTISLLVRHHRWPGGDNNGRLAMHSQFFPSDSASAQVLSAIEWSLGPPAPCRGTNSPPARRRKSKQSKNVDLTPSGGRTRVANVLDLCYLAGPVAIGTGGGMSARRRCAAIEKLAFGPNPVGHASARGLGLFGRGLI